MLVALVMSTLPRERGKDPLKKVLTIQNSNQGMSEEEENLLRYLQPQQESRPWRNQKFEDLGKGQKPNPKPFLEEAL
ncbi:hypothetical protein CR513_51407, partial [Mucuna pruriens]